MKPNAMRNSFHFPKKMHEIPEVYADADKEFRSSKRSFGYRGLYSSLDFPPEQKRGS